MGVWFSFKRGSTDLLDFVLWTSDGGLFKDFFKPPPKIGLEKPQNIFGATQDIDEMVVKKLASSTSL